MSLWYRWDKKTDEITSWVLDPFAADFQDKALENEKYLQDIEGRRVAFDTFGPFRLSTIFLAFDHGFSRHGQDPILFETCLFHENGQSQVMARYETSGEARAAHNYALTKMKNFLSVYPNASGRELMAQGAMEG